LKYQSTLKTLEMKHDFVPFLEKSVVAFLGEENVVFL